MKPKLPPWPSMGLIHTAAMLRNENFRLAPPKLFPKHFTSRLRVPNLLSIANMAAARIRPICCRVEKKRAWFLMVLFTCNRYTENIF